MVGYVAGNASPTDDGRRWWWWWWTNDASRWNGHGNAAATTDGGHDATGNGRPTWNHATTAKCSVERTIGSVRGVLR